MNKQVSDVITLLRVAMSLEALTIPPYLTAYWSIKDNPTTKDNQEAKKIIHSVAMEEMLHMMSVGNIIAALGACPLYYNKCNTLENWEENKLPVLNFNVKLAPFSIEQVKKFLLIEKPVKPIDIQVSLLSHPSPSHTISNQNLLVQEIIAILTYFLSKNGELDSFLRQKLVKLLENFELEPILATIDTHESEIPFDREEKLQFKLLLIRYYIFEVDNKGVKIQSSELKMKFDACKTIGEFYSLVIDELRLLEDSNFQDPTFKQLDLSHDPRVGTIEQRTIPSFIVDSKEKAVKLLEWVVDQGEGSEVPMDTDGELAHYYRFKQITKGYYIQKDENGVDCFNYNKPFQVEEDEIYVRHKNNVDPQSEDEKQLQDRLSKNFNDGYFNMFKELQSFYLTGERRYIMQSFDYMMKMSTNAEILMDSGAYPDFKFEN